MSVDQDFDDTVRICEFYSDPREAFGVDLENRVVMMGGREISLVRWDGNLVGYLVIESDGVPHLEVDLDSYFQSELKWEVRE